MKLCFNCKHKCIVLNNLNEDLSHQDMVHAKDNIYVKCLKGNSVKIVALYRDYSHMTVGTLENMCFECFEMPDVVMYMESSTDNRLNSRVAIKR